jgi:hypothetical protein
MGSKELKEIMKLAEKNAKLIKELQKENMELKKLVSNKSGVNLKNIEKLLYKEFVEKRKKKQGTKSREIFLEDVFHRPLRYTTHDLKQLKKGENKKLLEELYKNPEIHGFNVKTGKFRHARLHHGPRNKARGENAKQIFFEDDLTYPNPNIRYIK